MKKIYSLLLFVLISSLSFAQARMVDVKCEIVKPANGTIIPVTETFPVEFKVINNTDVLIKAGDTVIYTWDFENINGAEILSKNLAKGEFATFKTKELGFQQGSEPDGLYDTEVCIGVSILNRTDTVTESNDKVGDNVGCSAIKIQVAIEESTNNVSSANIYPNPASDILNISYVNNASKEVNVNIYNVAGQVVYTENLGSNAGNINRAINISSLSSGMYIIELNTETNIVREQLIITK